MQLSSVEQLDLLPVQTHIGFTCNRKMMKTVDSGIVVLSLAGELRNHTGNDLLTGE